MTATPPTPSPRIGVLLVNLGTPDAPETRAVRRYLRQFLSDSRVLTLPPPLRWLLLNAVILPTRPARSAAAYRAIWTDEGSPLLVHSRALAAEVSTRLGPAFRVELAMRYGRPSIAAGLEALEGAGVERIVVVPLFPQYASSVSASLSAEVFRLLAARNDVPPVEILGDFHAAPGFVEGWAKATHAALSEFAADHVLWSFHGLPEDQIRASDPRAGHCLSRPDCCDAPGASQRRCYRAQCFATAAAMERALSLDPARTSVAFQSRLGPSAWIQPYTDRVVEELAERGVKRLAVYCPSFVADCLETLEEIGLRLRERWSEVGGEAMWLAPCPNGEAYFADFVAERVRARA